MPPKMPQPKPAVRIPTPDDPDIAASRMAAMRLEEQNRQGRKSTDLTGGSSGQAYTRTRLG